MKERLDHELFELRYGDLLHSMGGGVLYNGVEEITVLFPSKLSDVEPPKNMADAFADLSDADAPLLVKATNPQ